MNESTRDNSIKYSFAVCAVSMIMQVSDIGPKWLPFGNPYEDMLYAIKKTPMMRWKWLPSSYDNAIGIN